MTILFQLRNSVFMLTTCSMLVLVSGCNKPAEPARTDTPGTTIGTEVNDTVITSKVEEALLTDESIKSFPIKVKTENGEVVLSGFVKNQQQIDMSITLTKAVKGVKVVINQLAVKDSTNSADNKIGDGLVTSTVKTALLNDSALKSFDISVVTRNGEVMLSGFVDNPAQAAHSVDVAQGIEGVKSVLNHMVVKGT